MVLEEMGSHLPPCTRVLLLRDQVHAAYLFLFLLQAFYMRRNLTRKIKFKLLMLFERTGTGSRFNRRLMRRNNMILIITNDLKI